METDVPTGKVPLKARSPVLPVLTAGFGHSVHLVFPPPPQGGAGQLRGLLTQWPQRVRSCLAAWVEPSMSGCSKTRGSQGLGPCR